MALWLSLSFSLCAGTALWPQGFISLRLDYGLMIRPETLWPHEGLYGIAGMAWPYGLKASSPHWISLTLRGLKRSALKHDGVGALFLWFYGLDMRESMTSLMALWWHGIAVLQVVLELMVPSLVLSLCRHGLMASSPLSFRLDCGLMMRPGNLCPHKA